MITQEDGLRADDSNTTEYEVQDLLVMLVRVLRPKLVVETGAYMGATTEMLGKAVHSYGGRVVSCEPNLEHCAEARKRCSGLPVTIYGRKSEDVLEVQHADFLFLDSDCKFRQQEFLRTKRGAVVVMHDTHISNDPDIKPLEWFVRAVGGITLQTYRGLGIIARP